MSALALTKSPCAGRMACDLCGEIRRCGLCTACLPEKDTADTHGRHRAGNRPIQATQGEYEMKKEKLKITKSSGNIFIDIGFPPDEAAILSMRADLMCQLEILIRDKEWTQAEAAKVLGISQSRVSDLIRGKWDKFSLDMLITLATRAGKKVELKLAA